jgi:hypothetical protein
MEFTRKKAMVMIVFGQPVRRTTLNKFSDVGPSPQARRRDDMNFGGHSFSSCCSVTTLTERYVEVHNMHVSFPFVVPLGAQRNNLSLILFRYPLMEQQQELKKGFNTSTWCSV